MYPGLLSGKADTKVPLAYLEIEDEKVKTKIQYTLELIKQVDRVPEKFLKHLTGADNLYEIRIEHQSNIYRVFAALIGIG